MEYIFIDIISRAISGVTPSSFTLSFINSFISSSLILLIIAFNPDDYDYSDISMVFHNQFNTLSAYNTKLKGIDPNYRSKNMGLSFNDIIQSIDIIDEIDLNRIDSMISSYRLTKDKQKLIVYYEYVIEQLNFKKGKLVSSEGISKDMLDKIDNTGNDIIFDDSNTNSKESYFSNLILKTSSFGSNLAEIQGDIDFYTEELNELNGDVILGIDKNEKIIELELLIDSTFLNLQNWIVITNDTSSEFYDKLMTRAITSLSPAEVYSDVNMKLNLAIGLVLGLMMGIGIAFFKEYWKQS
jgi:hypothetical protein